MQMLFGLFLGFSIFNVQFVPIQFLLWERLHLGNVDYQRPLLADECIFDISDPLKLCLIA